jgi:hypothetical protein
MLTNRHRDFLLLSAANDRQAHLMIRVDLANQSSQFTGACYILTVETNDDITVADTAASAGDFFHHLFYGYAANIALDYTLQSSRAVTSCVLDAEITAVALKRPSKAFGHHLFGARRLLRVGSVPLPRLTKREPMIYVSYNLQRSIRFLFYVVEALKPCDSKIGCI